MGYLIIDDRASGGSVREYDTTHCRHCQAVIDKKKWAEDKGIWKCSQCRGPVCHHCSAVDAPAGLCDPWEKKIERQLEYNKLVIGG